MIGVSWWGVGERGAGGLAACGAGGGGFAPACEVGGAFASVGLFEGVGLGVAGAVSCGCGVWACGGCVWA
jgi:hypothetical protein